MKDKQKVCYHEHTIVIQGIQLGKALMKLDCFLNWFENELQRLPIKI